MRNHCRSSRSPSISSEQQTESGGVSTAAAAAALDCVVIRSQYAATSRFHSSITSARTVWPEACPFAARAPGEGSAMAE